MCLGGVSPFPHISCVSITVENAQVRIEIRLMETYVTIYLKKVFMLT